MPQRGTKQFPQFGNGLLILASFLDGDNFLKFFLRQIAKLYTSLKITAF